MIADLGRYIASRQALAVSGRGPELVAGQGAQPLCWTKLARLKVGEVSL